MKSLWAEVVGFRAPDVVGKIVPEIKPGKYTYKDKEKYPGFKELMWPELYKRFNPGAPPHVGNFPEIEIVPTRQYYWALPIAKETKKNIGHTKLDDQGYIIYDTYIAGFPFPRPSGEFKGQQIIYNWEKNYINGENALVLTRAKGYTKNFAVDVEGTLQLARIRLHGRVLMEPYGYFDERARANREGYAMSMFYLSPRDMYGNVLSINRYTDRDKVDLLLMYINSLRRIRKMSATDTQDAVAGQDVIYDDDWGFSQRLSPQNYPYKIELIAEREYLVPTNDEGGSMYISSQGFEYRNIKFERRPLYVVKLTQLDKNYIYKYRVLYIDKETFVLYNIENFDQKGRLYRISENSLVFIPEMGLFFYSGEMFRDYIDLHSNFLKFFIYPAYLGRDAIDIPSLIRGVK